jgi:ribosomal protein S18 acetylase RimI-like enzyme
MSAAATSARALARAVDAWRREGLRVFWARMLAGLGLYRRIVLLECALDSALPEVEPTLPLEMRLLRESELSDYLELRGEADRGAVLRRLQSGQLCFVALYQGRIVSACWATCCTTWTEFLACDMHVGEGEVYFFDAFTDGSCRGQGIAPALCRHQLRYFQQAGLRRALRGTFDANAAALRAHAKSGFRPVGTLCRIKVGPWQRYYRRALPEQPPAA